MLRFSRRPNKQLLRFFMASDMKKSEGYEIGVDVGCSEMVNRPMFKTEKYVGIDFSKDKLEQGQKKYPSAQAVSQKFEDIEGIKGDFVVCTQTQSFGAEFNTDRPLQALKCLLKMTAEGGALIFNLHNEAALKHEDKIDSVVYNNFSLINKKYYGDRNESLFTTNKRDFKLYLSVGYALLIAGLMYFFPSLRTSKGRSYVYYFCQGKKFKGVSLE